MQHGDKARSCAAQPWLASVSGKPLLVGFGKLQTKKTVLQSLLQARPVFVQEREKEDRMTRKSTTTTHKPR